MVIQYGYEKIARDIFFILEWIFKLLIIFEGPATSPFAYAEIVHFIMEILVCILFTAMNFVGTLVGDPGEMLASLDMFFGIFSGIKLTFMLVCNNIIEIKILI